MCKVIQEKEKVYVGNTLRIIRLKFLKKIFKFVA